MNKLKLKNHKDGNIKEICYTLFHRGFSDSEIVKDYGFILKTVSGYRYKLKFKIEQKDATELLKERDTRTYDNTPIFSIAPVKVATRIFNEAGMSNLFSKSKKLTNYLQFLIDKITSDNIWITPRKSEDRGCQISVHVKQGGKELYNKLTESGVICDWREPDVIRIAPTPLYNSFTDVYLFYEILKTSVN